MFRRFGKGFLVFALVFAIGGHWAFLQAAAWVGMTITYAHTDRLSSALSKTFDGRHPCKLCKFVKEGKKAEQKSGARLVVKKLDFFSEPVTEFYFPRRPQTSSGAILPLFSFSSPPATPPPVSA